MTLTFGPDEPPAGPWRVERVADVVTGLADWAELAAMRRPLGWRGDRWEPDPFVLDDQAMIVNARDRGLVVITGCGHAGVVNTTRYAQALNGEPTLRLRLHQGSLAAVDQRVHRNGRSPAELRGRRSQAVNRSGPILPVPPRCQVVDRRARRILAGTTISGYIARVGCSVDAMAKGLAHRAHQMAVQGRLMRSECRVSVTGRSRHLIARSRSGTRWLTGPLQAS